MPRNAFNPNVNASLLHEIRMIAQQFFRHKENLNFWGGLSPTPAPALKCCFCHIIRKKWVNAITVMGGYAVCDRHKVYIETEEYIRIHARIFNDERRRS